ARTDEQTLAALHVEVFQGGDTPGPFLPEGDRLCGRAQGEVGLSEQRHQINANGVALCARATKALDAESPARAGLPPVVGDAVDSEGSGKRPKPHVERRLSDEFSFRRISVRRKRREVDWRFARI